MTFRRFFLEKFSLDLDFMLTEEAKLQDIQIFAKCFWKVKPNCLRLLVNRWDFFFLFFFFWLKISIFFWGTDILMKSRSGFLSDIFVQTFALRCARCLLQTTSEKSNNIFSVRDKRELIRFDCKNWCLIKKTFEPCVNCWILCFRQWSNITNFFNYLWPE